MNLFLCFIQVWICFYICCVTKRPNWRETSYIADRNFLTDSNSERQKWFLDIFPCRDTTETDIPVSLSRFQFQWTGILRSVPRRMKNINKTSNDDDFKQTAGFSRDCGKRNTRIPFPRTKLAHESSKRLAWNFAKHHRSVSCYILISLLYI